MFLCGTSLGYPWILRLFQAMTGVYHAKTLFYGDKLGPKHQIANPNSGYKFTSRDHNRSTSTADFCVAGYGVSEIYEWSSSRWFKHQHQFCEFLIVSYIGKSIQRTSTRPDFLLRCQCSVWAITKPVLTFLIVDRRLAQHQLQEECLEQPRPVSRFLAHQQQRQLPKPEAFLDQLLHRNRRSLHNRRLEDYLVLHPSLNQQDYLEYVFAGVSQFEIGSLDNVHGFI